jgi:hypothetical protein
MQERRPLRRPLLLAAALAVLLLCLWTTRSAAPTFSDTVSTGLITSPGSPEAAPPAQSPTPPDSDAEAEWFEIRLRFEDRHAFRRSVFPLRDVDRAAVWMHLRACAEEPAAEPFLELLDAEAEEPGAHVVTAPETLLEALPARADDEVCAALVSVERALLSGKLQRKREREAGRKVTIDMTPTLGAIQALRDACADSPAPACELADLYALDAAHDILGSAYDPSGAAALAVGMLRSTDDPLIREEALAVLVVGNEPDVGLTAEDLEVVEAMLDPADPDSFDLASFLTAQRLAQGDEEGAARALSVMDGALRFECANGPCDPETREVADLVGRFVAMGRVAPRSWKDAVEGALWACHFDGVAVGGDPLELDLAFDGSRWQVDAEGPFAECARQKLGGIALLPHAAAEGTATLYPPMI